jgi:ParB family chromosome partitioning protein
MTSSKKKRLSMLDSLAAAGTPGAGTGSMMHTNRALRSARDAVDSHHVWDLDPAQIEDGRIADRLDPADVADLRDAIEANGQTVPILVRRHPTEDERYLLVYGRRRLEAIRQSDKVQKVRALVANLDDHAAVRAQISENMARRDLSFIEKASFARELIDQGFGNQTQVAEVLTVTKSSISMALAIVEMVGPDLIRAIGPAHGIGRPRWEALGKAIAEAGIEPAQLAAIADDVHTSADTAAVLDGPADDPADVSLLAFEAVEKAVRRQSRPSAPPAPPRAVPLKLDGRRAGSVRHTPKGLTIALEDGPFANWLAGEAQQVIDELHARFKQAED